jgi:hypothetical protein
MYDIPMEGRVELTRRQTDTAEQIRAAVFWAFILLVIVSPAILSAWILAQP